MTKSLDCRNCAHRILGDVEACRNCRRHESLVDNWMPPTPAVLASIEERLREQRTDAALGVG